MAACSLAMNEAAAHTHAHAHAHTNAGTQTRDIHAQITRTHGDKLGTVPLELVHDGSLPGLFVTVERVALVGVVEEDVFALARRGGLHRQGYHAVPLSPDIVGRAWRGCCSG